MKPEKFLFEAGDDIPAESFNTIDPDNPPVNPVDDAYKLVRLDENGYNQANFFFGTAGEDITVTAGLPVAVYIKPSDGKIYKSLASATASALFDGFLLVSCSTDDSVKIKYNGILNGFTGLTIGTTYFISNTAGLLTATVTSSDYPQMVGKAISATSIIIDRMSKVFSEYLVSSGGIPASRTVTATKPWKYCYATVDPYASSGSVRGGTVYLERGVITSASQPGDDSYVGISISGHSITASYGNGDTGGVGALYVYFYAN